MKIDGKDGFAVASKVLFDAPIDEPHNENSGVAVVKWFRVDKGYGFVDLNDGRGDVFLHAKTLRRFGAEAVLPGMTLRVEVDETPRGRQVARVIAFDANGSPPSVSGDPQPRQLAPRPALDLSSATAISGKVKFFDEVRGFGFIAADDFGRDVFVHCSIFGPAGVTRLVEGQSVTMQVIQSLKGRQAVQISV